MKQKEKQQMAHTLQAIITQAAAVQYQARQALAQLAGGGIPASARKGSKVNTTEIVTKRRERLFKTT